MVTRTLAVVSFAVATASAPAAADPFSDLTKNGACFVREYDAAHLRKNPRQQITTMAVWVRAVSDKSSKATGNFGLAVKRRADPQPLFLSGGCDWQPIKAERDWVTSFKKNAAAGCVTLAVPDVFPDASSAEEGGAVVLDPAADGRTMMVHLDERQSMVKRANRARKISIAFGSDDRAFLLRRADMKACDFVKDAVTTMESRV